MPDHASTPVPGFCIKLTAPNGAGRHYVNVCSHPSIERPQNAREQEVDDSHLHNLGIDNLRVPLLTGPPRTLVLPGEAEAVCMDVVFSPAVLSVALPPADAPAAPGEVDPPPSRAQLLGRTVRARLVELALKNAEDDLGYKLGRASTLPRGVAYKGGIGGGRTPVPMTLLRQLTAAAAAQASKGSAGSVGPWSSKREQAGLSTRAKIEELGSAGLVPGPSAPTPLPNPARPARPQSPSRHQPLRTAHHTTPPHPPSPAPPCSTPRPACGRRTVPP